MCHGGFQGDETNLPCSFPHEQCTPIAPKDKQRGQQHKQIGRQTDRHVISTTKKVRQADMSGAQTDRQTDRQTYKSDTKTDRKDKQNGQIYRQTRQKGQTDRQVKHIC